MRLDSIADLQRALALHQRADPVSDFDRVRVRFDADGYMTFLCGEHELEEITVSHENIPKPAAVDIATLRRQFEQRWVHEQFFVSISFGRAGPDSAGL